MSLVKAKKNRFLSMTFAMVFGAFILSSAVQSAEPELSDSLFQTIDERLGYMEDVALFKAQNRIPVEDIAREKVVLFDAKELASSHRLNPDSMERFFIAQISAAKAIQYRYSAELLTLEMPTRSIDLQSEIRPALDQLGSEIVSLFSALLESRATIVEKDREQFMNTLQSRLLDDSEREALFDAMLEVRRSQ
jgi:chorismate mutase